MSLISLTSQYSETAARMRRNAVDIEDSVHQLSTGRKFRQAADDVANISIASKLLSRSTGLRSGVMNAMQASSLLQVADGGLNEITNILQRMHVVSTMASSGALSQQDRGYLNMEYQQLMQQVDNIALTIKFNDRQVLTFDAIPAEAGRVITGSTNGETLVGNIGDDTIRGNDGNDIIAAGVGNDVIEAGRLHQPGLLGSIYLTPGAITSLAQAEAFVAANPPNAQFVSTGVDYPQGAVNIGGATIGAFLGTDAASLTVPAVGAAVSDRMIFVFDGYINIPADGNYTFNLGSDDGFDLRIGGNLVSQFATNRGFGVTTATVFLTQGQHDFRLLYWENGGGNGVELDSNVPPGGIVGPAITEYDAVTDGNDTIDGESGDDVLVLTGNQSDYNISQIGPKQFQITDLRTNSPDGTDIITNVERLRFASGSEVNLFKAAPEIKAPDGTLRFNLGESSQSYFDYKIVDARTRSLFDDAPHLNLLSGDAAKIAADATLQAIDRATSLRAYVGSKHEQAGLATDGLRGRMNEFNRAYSSIADTDIAAASTAYAQQIAKQDAAINVQAQAELLRFDSVTIMVSDAARVLTGESGNN